MPDQGDQQDLLQRVVLDALPHGVVLVDAAGIICYANPRAAELLEVRSELLGAQIGSFFSDLGPLLVEGPFRHWYKDKYLLCQARAVSHHGLSGPGVLLTLADWSEESAFIQAEIGSVFTVLSTIHTPIVPAHGFAELLLAGGAGPLEPGVREFVETIRANTLRIRTFIEAMLDLGRAQSGRWRGRLEVQPLSSLVASVHASIAPAFEEAAVGLSIQLPPEDVRFITNPSHFTRILSALLDNARKYTLPGGSVTVLVSLQDDTLCIVVKDTGVGIREEDQRRIFQPFGYAYSQRHEYPYGNGLSLAIAKGLVQTLGGRIWFESVEGQGSTFSFTLPLAERPEDSSAPFTPA